jgi:hypothetical protein
MTDPVDLRFFTSLQKVLARSDTVDTACRDAVDRALATGAPEDLRIAREKVHALPTEFRERVLAQVHAAMASDLSAIWDMMPTRSGAGRPN